MLAFGDGLRQRGSLTATHVLLTPQQPGDAATVAGVLVPLFMAARTQAAGAPGGGG